MLALLLACAAPQPAEVVYTGHVHPTAGSEVSALAVSGGRVLALGEDAEALIGAGTEVVELGDEHLFPGFQDAHTHLLAGSFAMDRLLLLGMSSMEMITNAVEDYAPTVPDEPWVFGYGWLMETVEDPSGVALDEVVPDRPVLLVDNSGHQALANSEAQRRAGITADTPDPDSGEIVRDPETGEPTGWLVEAAMGLVTSVALTDYSDEVLTAGLEDDMAAFVEAGVGGVAEIMAVPGVNLTRPWLYQELEQDGALPLRVHYYLPIFSVEDIYTADEYRGLYDGERVRLAGAKIWVDGSMGTATSWVLDPMSDDPNDYGISYFSEAELTEVAREAEARGIPLKLHANGDAAVQAALNAFETVAQENGGLTLQHTLDHVVLVADGDLERMRSLGLVASVQPSHFLGAALGDVADRLGDERFEHAYDVAALEEGGVTMALGTDWPVWIAQQPMLNIWSAVTLEDRAMSIEGAMTAYSEGSARAVGQADGGRLEPGCAADFVLLDADPLTLGPDDVSDVDVKGVYVAGERVD